MDYFAEGIRETLARRGLASSHGLEKAAQSAFLETLANLKILDDLSNSDLHSTIAEMDEDSPSRRRRSRKNTSSGVTVKFDPGLLSQLTPAQRRRLFIALGEARKG